MRIVLEDKIRFKRSEQLYANFAKLTKYCLRFSESTILVSPTENLQILGISSPYTFTGLFP